MGFMDFFTKDIETKDHHKNPQLRTHYYKAEYPQVKEVLLNFFKERGTRVVNVDDNFGEILVVEPAFDLIVSIKRVSVVQHAVDFKVNSKGLIGAKRPFKVVRELYELLDKKLNFAGIGLTN